jgi:metal-responsive CopG/Arc/MetJ family transcriptional regulator
VSLRLSNQLIVEIDKRTLKEPDRNRSRLVEDSVKSCMDSIENIPTRRENGVGLTKKTFSFTHEFAKELKKQQNMSFYVETILQRIFKK